MGVLNYEKQQLSLDEQQKNQWKTRNDNEIRTQDITYTQTYMQDIVWTNCCNIGNYLMNTLLEIKDDINGMRQSNKVTET